jgi:hypothetical protein
MLMEAAATCKVVQLAALCCCCYCHALQIRWRQLVLAGAVGYFLLLLLLPRHAMETNQLGDDQETTMRRQAIVRMISSIMKHATTRDSHAQSPPQGLPTSETQIRNQPQLRCHRTVTRRVSSLLFRARTRRLESGAHARGIDEILGSSCHSTPRKTRDMFEGTRV